MRYVPIGSARPDCVVFAPQTSATSPEGPRRIAEPQPPLHVTTPWPSGSRFGAGESMRCGGVAASLPSQVMRAARAFAGVSLQAVSATCFSHARSVASFESGAV